MLLVSYLRSISISTLRVAMLSLQFCLLLCRVCRKGILLKTEPQSSHPEYPYLSWKGRLGKVLWKHGQDISLHVMAKKSLFKDPMANPFLICTGIPEGHFETLGNIDLYLEFIPATVWVSSPQWSNQQEDFRWRWLKEPDSESTLVSMVTCWVLTAP